MTTNFKTTLQGENKISSVKHKSKAHGPNYSSDDETPRNSDIKNMVPKWNQFKNSKDMEYNDTYTYLNDEIKDSNIKYSKFNESSSIKG